VTFKKKLVKIRHSVKTILIQSIHAPMLLTKDFASSEQVYRMLMVT
jgi:hypothetical protein